MSVIRPTIAHTIINAAGGVAKENKYRVVMPTLFVGGDAITMDVLCRSTSLPGRDIKTIDRKTNQKTTKTPSGYELSDVEMSFTELVNRNVTRYFDIWLASIVDHNNYGIAYKDDITKDILIMSTDDGGVPNYVVTLKDAYPITKTPVILTDKNQNTATEISVTFNYDDVKIHDSLLLSGISDLARSIRGGGIQPPTNILRDVTRGIF